MWGMHDGTGWWVLGLIWMVLFWSIVIAGVAWLISSIAGRGRGATDDALEVARGRYARGEIGRDEFQRISDDLANARHS